jgi:Domain of unknown function (DUF1989)
MYRIQYGVTDYHANCHDNLLSALRELGIEPDSLPTAFNFCMNVDVLPDGRLKFAPPTCRAGDSMVLRAEAERSIVPCPIAEGISNSTVHHAQISNKCRGTRRTPLLQYDREEPQPSAPASNSLTQGETHGTFTRTR